MDFHYTHYNERSGSRRALMDQVMLFRSAMTPQHINLYGGCDVCATTITSNQFNNRADSLKLLIYVLISNGSKLTGGF